MGDAISRLVVAEHTVLCGRAQLSVQPQYGPGTAARNVRQRHGGLTGQTDQIVDRSREVEVRNLSVYEQLRNTGLKEAA